MSADEAAAGEVVVTFLGEGKVVRAPAGANLRALAQANGVRVYRFFDRFANCGGRGECGTCVVELVEGAEHASPPGPLEAELLARKGGAKTRRLACQVTVHGPLSVRTRV